MVRYAVMESQIMFDNVDYIKALRYLRIVGGKDYMVENGMKMISPVWKGKKGWILTVGGDKSKEEIMWRDARRELTEKEKRKILSHVMEVAVLVSMTTHLYSFGGKTYIQASGGPIGMRATASLASIMMKIWDVA